MLASWLPRHPLSPLLTKSLGGAGTDTLKLTVSGAQDAGVTIPAATITGVENMHIRNVVAQTASINASNFAGVTAINADRSTGDVAVTAVATGASVGMIGDGTVANGTLSYAYATPTADQVINIAGGTVNTATANITATASTGVTKATIKSTGAANKVDTILLDSAAGSGHLPDRQCRNQPDQLQGWSRQRHRVYHCFGCCCKCWRHQADRCSSCRRKGAGNQHNQHHCSGYRHRHC